MVKTSRQVCSCHLGGILSGGAAGWRGRWNTMVYRGVGAPNNQSADTGSGHPGFRINTKCRHGRKCITLDSWGLNGPTLNDCAVVRESEPEPRTKLACDKPAGSVIVRDSRWAFWAL